MCHIGVATSNEVNTPEVQRYVDRALAYEKKGFLTRRLKSLIKLSE